MAQLKRSQGAVSGVDLKDVGKTVLNIGKGLFGGLYKLSYSTYRVLNKVEVGTVKGVATSLKTAANLPTIGKSIYNTTTTNGIVKPVPLKTTQIKPASTVKSGTGGTPWGIGNSPDKKPAPIVKSTPAGVKFNLPPHRWSLPVNQKQLNSTNLTTGIGQIDHSTRRAVMWCYGYGDLDAPADSTTTSTSTSTSLKPIDTNWGFQFLWNPEAIGNTLTRNANFTPSAVDKLSSLVSVFTAMEAISFKIVIDRVNDFACIKSNEEPNYETIANNFYKGLGYPGSEENTVDKLKDLANLGTLADIEYIYRMINGEGSGGLVFKNPLGRKTADLGFLAPTAIAVQFGPNPDSLSYVGYVNDIQVTHTLFTEDMIPIHSEVTVGFVAFARTSLSQG